MEEDKLTVLIVDDEESIRSILSRKLESDGYYCEVAADGKEALRKFSMRSFDLVLLDISMPGLSGMEVLRRLTADHPDTCVIMITAASDIRRHIEALKLGAYDYVSKPFDLDDVSARVKRALEIRRLVLKKGGRQLSPEQNEAIRSFICGQISPEELKAIHWPQDGESTPGAEFAILTFGSTTHPRELARYMQIARKLVLMAEIFRASVREHGEWVNLLGEEIVNQPGGYDDLIETINGLNIATTSDVSGKIHIPDRSLIESIPWAQAEDGGIRGRLASPDIIMPQLERLRDTILIAGVSNKRQREAGYYSNATYRHPYPIHFGSEEAVEAFLKLSREQGDSCDVDSFLQMLGQQMMMSQVPTFVET
jgi:DNA-binding response OmpR family regulator